MNDTFLTSEDFDVKEATGFVGVEELTEESTEIVSVIGGSTNSTRNTCRCPNFGFDN